VDRLVYCEEWGYVPAAASGLVVAFVAGGLGNEMADLGFDVGCCFHVCVVGEDVGVFDKDVNYRGIFEVLTKAADSNAVTAVTCNLK
jgi:hypothetical protein